MQHNCFGKSSAPCISSQEYLIPHGNVRTWNMTIANSTSCDLAKEAIYPVTYLLVPVIFEQSPGK